MLKADFLDDYDSMMDEILAFDQKPEIRIQGKGQGIKHYPKGPRMVEATVVLTHWDSRKQIIREAIIFVGEVEGDNEAEVEALQQRLRAELEVIREKVKQRGCTVKKGRWVG